MKTKPLTFLLALTFLFLFSGSVFADDFQDATDAYERVILSRVHGLKHHKSFLNIVVRVCFKGSVGDT